MEATLVGAVVGATVQVGLQNVLTSIQEIISMASNYEEYLEELKKSLEMVQGFLSYAEANKVNSESLVKLWLHRLEDAAFDADAVLDKVKYELLRCQVENQNQASNKVMEFFSSTARRELVFKKNMSGEIKDVINKLKRINNDAKDLGLQIVFALERQMNTMRFVTPTERQTDSFSGEHVIGRENYVSKIVEKLKAPSQETICVIPIVGMGGVGKTTVARKVFNDEKIRNHFGKKIWLSVSFKFDAVSLLNMILGALTLEKEAEFTKEIALQKIKKLLVNKTYLIVLDDVWYGNDGKWDDFISSLSTISNVNGNCIVVTTRSHARTHPTDQLGVLTNTQCWSIIEAEAFRGKDDSKRFEKIGKQIAEKCGGLPLAAKVVGGLLRGKSEGDWYSILKNKLSDNVEIEKILRLSYDYLPSSPLKKCFAYCSIFSKGYRIRRQRVIEFWMAEGFLQAGKSNDMEIEGNKIFNHLLQHSLFQDVDKDVYDDIVSCKMHDFVHDLACSITTDMHRVRYLELEFANGNELQKMMSLRTLLFNGTIVAEMFSNFKCLHVLILTCKKITDLPLAIEKLTHMRSLDIQLTNVKLLPDSIGKLYHLQSLSTAEYLEKLPSTIVTLVSLRHLHTSANTELPPDVGKLISLRTLPLYKVRNENGCGIGELGKLKNLKGKLGIENLEMVKDKKEAELADLYGKKDILHLVLKWNESSDDNEKHKEVLEGLQPHPLLRSLDLIGYGSKNLPLWTMRMAVPNNIDEPWEAFASLQFIKLVGFRELEALPMFGHLPSLKSLVLEDLPNVQCTCFSSYVSKYYSTTVLFPALEELHLLRIPKLTEFLDVEEETSVLPCLKSLTIQQCPKLKSLHGHFHCLTKLEVYDMDADLLTYLCSNTNSLQDIEIKTLSGLVSLPVELFTGNKNLTRLDIRNCPELTRLVPSSLGGGTSIKSLSIWNCKNLEVLPDDLSTLCGLEKLEIEYCPGLKSIPYDVSEQSQGLASLRDLCIIDCKGLTDLPIELLRSCTSSLERLTLWDLENMENLDFLIPCLARMSRLYDLDVTRLPKLMIFPTEIGCLRSLRRLSIGGFSDSIHVASLNDGLAIILDKCRSIKSLTLYGKEDWDSLPDSIKNLTDLQRLVLVDFGIEYIPDLFSLQHLFIWNCKRLRHLPSKEAMEHLYLLYITGCPLLTDRCLPENTEHDSQWPKICHIRTVMVDRELLPTKGKEDDGNK